MRNFVKNMALLLLAVIAGVAMVGFTVLSVLLSPVLMAMQWAERKLWRPLL